MKTEYKHAISYVNWREEAQGNYHYGIPIETFNNIVKSLDKKLMAASRTKRSDWCKEGKWFLTTRGNYKLLYMIKDGKYTVYTTNSFDDTKNIGKYINEGKEAANIVNKKFREKYGVLPSTAFGSVPFSFQSFVPKSVYYVNTKFCRRKVYNVFKDDWSSNFPACACGRMPQAKDHIDVDRYEKPSEEYPFAFYPDTNHIAEFGVFDSHEWKKSPLWENVRGNIKDGEDSRTILMKASPFEYTPIMYELYDVKNKFGKDTLEYTEAKLVLNAYLGTTHPKKEDSRFPKMYHIAAVFIGRSTDKTLKQYDRIVKDGNNVLQIVVDGFLYTASRPYGVEKKSLGALVSEYKNCVLDMCEAISNYIIYDREGNVLEVKHGSKQMPDEDFIAEFDLIRTKSRERKEGFII